MMETVSDLQMEGRTERYQKPRTYVRRQKEGLYKWALLTKKNCCSCCPHVFREQQSMLACHINCSGTHF